MREEKILNQDWIKYGQWTQPTISGAFWAHWHEASFTHDVMPKMPLPEILYLNGYHLSLVSEDKLIDDFFRKLYKEGQLEVFFSSFEAEVTKREQALLQVLDLKSISNKQYAEVLFKNFVEIVSPWAFLFRFSSTLEKLTEEFGLAKDEEDIMVKMEPYKRVTWLEQQSLEITDFAQRIKALNKAGTETEMLENNIREIQPEILISIEEHVKRFEWFGTHHWEGEGYSLEKAFLDITSATNKEIIEKDPQEKEMIPGDNEYVWKVLAGFAYWRTHCAEVAAKVVYESRERLINIAQNWGLSYEELTWLSAEEILIALKKDEHHITLPANFSERSKEEGYGVYVVDGGKEEVFTREKLTQYIQSIIPKVDTAVSEIKGTIASKGGIVKGVVRVIMGPRDFHSFEEGDILVANETTPDFVPLMKKAAAIITDTGGITSHAAIVSRELKKPCITGTKISTEVLKNGDVVEVNTETGVITKL